MKTALIASLGVLLLSSCSSPEHQVITVDYDPKTGDRTTMDVMIPQGTSGANPAVFLVHGGGWEVGDKSAMRRMAEPLADLGYVTVSVGYRLIPEGVYPFSSQDVSCAWDFFIANAKEYNVDPKRVAVLGYSAGGHLTNLHATGQSVQSIANRCGVEKTTVRPAAAISSAGLSSLLDVNPDDTTETFLGGTKDAARATWIEASPITHVDPTDPPFLFVHGEDDVVVNHDQAKKMYDALKKAGVEARLMTIPGGGHLFNPGPGGGDSEGGSPEISPEGLVVIEAFLNDHLRTP